MRTMVLLLLYSGVQADYGGCKLGAGTKNVSIVGTTLDFMAEHVCTELQALQLDHPEMGITTFDKKDILLMAASFGRTLQADIELVQHEAFETGNTPYDVYSVGGAWWQMSVEHFAPLSESVDTVLPVFQKRNGDAEHIGVPHLGSRLVMYYRKDLFEKHGAVWPETMGEFDSTVAAVMEAERAEGADDFWGLLIPSEDSGNVVLTQLTLLLTSEVGAGRVVEDDGRVSINNPSAGSALSRWRSWLTSIAPPNSFSMDKDEARDLFNSGNALIIVDWTSKMDKYEVLLKKKGYDVAIGPTPGAEGAGVLGGQSSFAPKSAPSRAIATEYLAAFAENLHAWTVQKRNSEPLASKTLEDPELLKEYCDVSSHRIVCESLERDPAFWKRMGHRPDAGCRALFRGCMDVTYKHVGPFLSSLAPVSEILGEFEKDLHELLGYSQPATSHSENSDGWRNVLAVVATVSGLVLIVLGAFVARQNRRMRREDGSCGIPISVCLGLVVLIFIGTLSGALVAKSDSALRSVSLDMSLEVRMQALSVMSTTLELTLQGMDRPDLSSMGVIQAALVEVQNSFARQRVLDGSIIVVVDKEDGRVLVSSDRLRQPEQTVYPNVHPWVRDALGQLEFAVRAVDSTRTLDVTDDEGTPALCNQRQVSVGSEFGLGRRREWVLMYITPEHVILGKATVTREDTLYIGLSLALIALICVVLCSVIVTNPLVHLAEDMEHVRTMNLDMVSDTKFAVFTELRSLRAGFDAMKELLVYYKAFMPQSVLVDTTDDGSESSQIDATSYSRPRSGGSSSHRDRHNSSRLSASARSSGTTYKEQAAYAVLSMGLRRRRVALMLVNLRAFDGLNDETAMRRYARYLEVLLMQARHCRGVVDCVSGDKATVSFNAATRAPQCEKNAIDASISLLPNLLSDTPGNVAAISGTVRCGNMGTSIMKNFVVVGALVKTLWRLERWGALWDVPFVIDETMRPSAGLVAHTRKVLRVGDKATIWTLYEVTEMRTNLATDEWMYQLDEMERNDPHAAENTVFDAVYQGDLRTAVAMYEDLPIQEQERLAALLDLAKQNKLEPFSFHGLIGRTDK